MAAELSSAAPLAVSYTHLDVYKRQDEQSARRVVAAHRAGRLDLEHLRGRTCWPMSVQAAEIGLRRHLQLTPWGGVRLVTRQPVAGGEPGTATVEVRFAVADPGVAGGTASDAPFAGLDQWVVCLLYTSRCV